MPDRCQQVAAANARVVKLAVITLRNILEVIIATHLRFRTQSAHHPAPLRPMGLYRSMTVTTIDHIVGNLMNYGIFETIDIELGKYPRIVTNAPMTATNLVHSSAAAAEVEIYRQVVKRRRQVSSGKVNRSIGCCAHLLLLLRGNRLDHEPSIIVHRTATIARHNDLAIYYER